MKKNGRVHVLFCLGIILLPAVIHGQDFINTRKISITRADTVVVAGILADVKIETVDPGIYYYWYSNDRIFSNQGGYAGNLLHGEYVEYGPDGTLLLKGHYDRGVRSGTWLSWYPEGAIKEKRHYVNGAPDGQITCYGPDGRIHFDATYRKGILHGKMTTVERDTLFLINYRKGVEKKRNAVHVFQ